jgi:hypothetical protein
MGHCFQLQNTGVVAEYLSLLDRIIREAVEIYLHSSNLNSEDGFSLSRSSKLLK